MDIKAVYKKTQKGQEEMAQRTVLGMRERTLLVMVDGKPLLRIFSPGRSTCRTRWGFLRN